MFNETELNALLRTPDFLKQKDYWADKLSGHTAKTEIPPGYRVRDPGVPGEQARVDISLPGSLCRKLFRLGKDSNLSIGIILLTALKSLVYRYTSNEDITVATPVYKRQISPQTINSCLFIRDQVNARMSFKELMLRVRQSVLDAHENQDYPFDKLTENLDYGGRERHDIDITTLLFSLKNIHADVKIKKIPVKLSFVLERENGTVGGAIVFDPRTYTGEFIKRLSAHFCNILENSIDNINENISRVPFLSAAEQEQLIYGFNNNRAAFSREKTIHQLIELNAGRVPHQIAIGWGDYRLTYRELNKRVNRLARVLRAKGITGDRLVGILSHRSPQMVISILAVWKAGGAYIPLDTRSPFKRTMDILDDSGAAVLITRQEYVQPDSRGDGRIEILVPDPREKPMDEKGADDLNLPVDMNGLAYVIYTSGSTGKPKGVIVEHIGMMNHIQAKINDLHVTARSIIAQNASHTFDISIWQFFTTLIPGGRTMIYSDDLILEPRRFISRVIADEITILEVVPSYLTVMLDELYLNFKPLESLHYLVVTGETFKAELVKKWFEKYPRIKAVNAYGPTEASDDITHCVMDTCPGNDIIPIGRSIQNLDIYIVDNHMNLCPVGVKGEICVSGVGVGRGYLNEETKTKKVFLEDPFIGEKGVRLFKTGDVGRWMPDGNIEFFGRKDYQVKIRGYRIELGEIESKLVAYPAVKDAVVIDKDDKEGNKYLCAYLSADGEIETVQIKEYLSENLPDYMVPAYFVVLNTLPLTANGKVDRGALRSLEETEPGIGLEYVPPTTEIEEKLVEIWEKVLNRKKIGINENFFMIGGDSIKAIQIISRMNQGGYKVEMREIFQYPSISALSPFVKSIDPAVAQVNQAAVEGEVPLTPIQQGFFLNPPVVPHHYNLSVMLYWKSEEAVDEAAVRAVFKTLMEHHDALRMAFRRRNGEIVQLSHGPEYPLSLEVYDLRDRPGTAKQVETMADRINQIHAGINLETGPLMKLGLFQSDDGRRLLIVVHHLVVDGISWRILLEDIETLFRQYKNKEPFSLPLKTTSFKAWAEKLVEYAAAESFLEEKSYWAELEFMELPPIKKDFDGGTNDVKNAGSLSFTLSEKETALLLEKVNRAFTTEVNDILLAALALAVKETFGNHRVLLALEGHGREEISEDIDISRTVGWFTSLYPVVLNASYEAGGENLGRQIKEIKESLRRIPNKGIGHGILRYLTPRELRKDLDFKLNPQIRFDYLGQFDTDNNSEGSSFGMAKESPGNNLDINERREFEFEISGMIANKQLNMSVSYNKTQYKEETAAAFVMHYQNALERIITYCSARKTRELTPADLSYSALSIETLEGLEKQYTHPVENIYTLSPMQEGMLFHSLLETDISVYFEQFSFRLQGELDVFLVEKSLELLSARYDILRTAFVYEGLDRPLQVVLAEREIEFHVNDIGGQTGDEQKKYIQEFKEKDRRQPFNLAGDVPMRLNILKTALRGYEFIWSFHHILMDGWCIGILIQELFEIYNSYLENRPHRLSKVTPYHTYIQWIEKRDKKEAREYWKKYLDFYDEPAVASGAGDLLPGEQEYTNKKVLREWSEEKTRKLNAAAAKYNVTVNTVIQTIWGILLGKYNHKRDVVFGAVVSGRPAEIKGVESMIGLFINTIPVRIRYESNATFNQLLLRVQERAIDSEPHHYFPLAEIQAESILKQNLFDHILIFENYPVAEQIEGMAYQGRKNDRRAKLELTHTEAFEQTNYDFNVIIQPGKKMSMSIDYNGSVFQEDFVKSIILHFDRLFGRVVENPEHPLESLTLLSRDERRELLYLFNDTEAEYPDQKTIHELFEEQEKRTPLSTAVSGMENSLTYKELNKKSNRLAHLLREKCIKPGTIVGIMMERSIEMIVGILGVLKAGGAYLPIDPEYPDARNAFILGDSRAGIVLTQKRSVEKHPYINRYIAPGNIIFVDDFTRNPGEGSPPVLSGGPGDAAYLIYTSGSTGKPKGVIVEHRSLVNYAWWAARNYVRNEKRNFPFYTSISFDLTVTSIFCPLITGNAVVVYGAGENEFLIKKIVEDEKVGTIKLTPSHLKLIKENKIERKTSGIKCLILGGEDLESDLAQAIDEGFNGSIDIYNEYGPTEATVGCMIHRFEPGKDNKKSVPLGIPSDNVKIYLLDGNLEPVVPGVPGEICISGKGISRGYLNRPETTHEKFVKNPFVPGERLYRTGDLARRRPGGNIEFLGRMDSQVKLRGYRIEPAEIETRLSEHEDINEAVVLAKEKKETGQTYIYAYFTSGKEISLTQLKTHLEKRLPAYMIPSYFVKVEKIPLTPNGKIDKRVLLSYEKNVNPEVEYTAPETDTEESVAAAWKEVLQIETVGVHENFFDVGGHSLLVIRVIGKLKAIFKKDIPVVTMFRYPTIRSMAQYLDNGDKGGGDADDFISDEEIDLALNVQEETNRLIFGDYDD